MKTYDVNQNDIILHFYCIYCDKKTDFLFDKNTVKYLDDIGRYGSDVFGYVLQCVCPHCGKHKMSLQINSKTSAFVRDILEEEIHRRENLKNINGGSETFTAAGVGLEDSALKASQKRSRPSKAEYYLGIAKAVSARSTCLRRQYGAIVVKNDEVISTGYNGSVRGAENCCDCGECWREKHKIPHGEQYEKCVAVHAEANCLISAARKDLIGTDLYLYGEENGVELDAKPCEICEKLIRNSGIRAVITSKMVKSKRLKEVGFD